MNDFLPIRVCPICNWVMGRLEGEPYIANDFSSTPSKATSHTCGDVEFIWAEGDWKQAKARLVDPSTVHVDCENCGMDLEFKYPFKIRSPQKLEESCTGCGARIHIHV